MMGASGMTEQEIVTCRNESAGGSATGTFRIVNDSNQAADQACSQHRRQCSNVVSYWPASSIKASSNEIMPFDDLES
jgi:hypothetical protein